MFICLWHIPHPIVLLHLMDLWNNSSGAPVIVCFVSYQFKTNPNIPLQFLYTIIIFNQLVVINIPRYQGDYFWMWRCGSEHTHRQHRVLKSKTSTILWEDLTWGTKKHMCNTCTLWKKHPVCYCFSITEWWDCPYPCSKSSTLMARYDHHIEPAYMCYNTFQKGAPLNVQTQIIGIYVYVASIISKFTGVE
jgi:hypothetical protein